MRKTAITVCWAVIAFCSACASDSAIQPDSLSSTNNARRGSEPNRLGDVASRINVALADVCECQIASDMGSTTLELCGYPIKVENTAELHASTNGKRIRITSGMLRFLAYDDELAFVLAHELSHILLGHAGAFDGISPKEAEIDADRLAIQIVSNSDFDMQIASKFPERLAQYYPSMKSRNSTYELPSKRTAMISSALREDSSPKVYANLRKECRK